MKVAGAFCSRHHCQQPLGDFTATASGYAGTAVVSSRIVCPVILRVLIFAVEDAKMAPKHFEVSQKLLAMAEASSTSSYSSTGTVKTEFGSDALRRDGHRRTLNGVCRTCA